MPVSSARLKLLVVSIAIASGIGLLTVESSRSATVYYQTIPEYRTAPMSARSVRLTGYVKAGSIVREPGKPLSFVMEDATKSTHLAVTFGGLVPDTFKDGAEVVVEGKPATASAPFHATTLLAKCPSKYESAEGRGAAPRT